MTTRLHLKCDGCDAETHSDGIRRKFIGFNGQSHGFGTYFVPKIDEVVEATGWVWSDPYTGCTYCPECWQSIEAAA